VQCWDVVATRGRMARAFLPLPAQTVPVRPPYRSLLSETASGRQAEGSMPLDLLIMAVVAALAISATLQLVGTFRGACRP